MRGWMFDGWVGWWEDESEVDGWVCEIMGVC